MTSDIWRRVMRKRVAAAGVFVIAMTSMNGCSNHAEDESADTEASSANIDESTPTTAKTTDTRPNAADEYIRIWAAMKGYGDASIADDSIDGMGPTLAEFLKAHQSQITEILSASKMERCDFSPVTGETGGRSYAGMREAQECAIILSNDAERFLQSGSAETAGVERLVAMGRMAQQMGKNRWLFSKVAAQASTSLMISRALKYEVRIVQTENRTSIVEQLKALRDGEMFNMHEGFEEEIDIAKQLYRKGKPVKLVTGQTIEFDSAAMESAIAQLRDAFSEMERAWRSPSNEREIKAIEERIKDPTVKALASGYSFAATSDTRIRGELDGAIVKFGH